MVERLKKAKSYKDIHYQTLKAERNALREHCDGVWNASQKLGEQITMLKAERDRWLNVIAEWANQEGIPFDATTRLSKALGLEETK
jgi:hypothetical protein